MGATTRIVHSVAFSLQGGLKRRLPAPLADAAYDLIFGIDNAKLVRAQVRYA